VWRDLLVPRAILGRIQASGTPFVRLRGSSGLQGSAFSNLCNGTRVFRSVLFAPHAVHRSAMRGIRSRRRLQARRRRDVPSARK